MLFVSSCHCWGRLPSDMMMMCHDVMMTWMTGWMDDSMTRWLDDQISRWPEQRTRWTDDRITGWPDDCMTWWPNYLMTLWPDDMMTWWQEASQRIDHMVYLYCVYKSEWVILRSSHLWSSFFMLKCARIIWNMLLLYF